MPGAALPLSFTLMYDAQVAQEQLTGDSSPGPLGHGWSYNLAASVAGDALGGPIVTEGNGAQDIFYPYSSTSSPAWCSGSTDYCAASPRTSATLNQNEDGSGTLVADVNSQLTYSFDSLRCAHRVTDSQGDSLTASSAHPVRENVLRRARHAQSGRVQPRVVR